MCSIVRSPAELTSAWQRVIQRMRQSGKLWSKASRLEPDGTLDDSRAVAAAAESPAARVACQPRSADVALLPSASGLDIVEFCVQMSMVSAAHKHCQLQRPMICYAISLCKHMSWR